MKTLNLHCDYIKFKALKKALKDIEEFGPQILEGKSNDCLVILIAAEKNDNQKTITEVVNDINKISEQIKTKEIILYPYAHLSSNLSSPKKAIDSLNQIESRLKEENFKILRAPFGYYKEFELKVKGHPLSELSREFSGELKINEEDEDFDPKKLLRSINKTILDTSKLKENDHRILGKKLDLYSFHDVAPGMVFWHNKGLIIRNELINWWRQEHQKKGYQEIKTPQILDKKLWQISGHWDKYKGNNFSTEYEKRKFLIKPMNCPGGLLIYKNSPKSYKDLPLKVAEIGEVHRVELSGVLSGLFRVIQFTQDDAHIFVTEEQAHKEITEIYNLISYFYKKFNLDFNVELSTRPEKRIGTDKMWDLAETVLEEVLTKLNVEFKINKGDGAFYGPKIDFHVKDSLNRTWQCGTIQVDFSMPERFEIEYIDKDNNKKTPIMLHRAIFGSLERFIGILIEHYNANLPLWLSPVQIKVLFMSEKNQKYSQEIYDQLIKENLRVELDTSQETINKKIRNAQLQKINYMIIIGDKEESSKTISIRTRDGKINPNQKIESFVTSIKKEIQEKS